MLLLSTTINIKLIYKTMPQHELSLFSVRRRNVCLPSVTSCNRFTCMSSSKPRPNRIRLACASAPSPPDWCISSCTYKKEKKKEKKTRYVQPTCQWALRMKRMQHEALSQTTHRRVGAHDSKVNEQSYDTCTTCSTNSVLCPYNLAQRRKAKWLVNAHKLLSIQKIIPRTFRELSGAVGAAQVNSRARVRVFCSLKRTV